MTVPQSTAIEVLAEKIKLDPKTNSKYFIVVSQDLEIIECEDKDSLIAKLRERREEERTIPSNNRAVIIHGKRAHLSKGEFKYVLFPDGECLPLFVEIKDMQPDEDGYLVEPTSSGKTEESEKFDTEELDELEEEEYVEDL